MPDFANAVPVWTVLPVTLALVLGCLWAGVRLGQRYRNGELEDTPVNSVTTAHLGLLAFFMAFTFNMASGHFDARRKLVVEEINAIDTAYFAANLSSDKSQGEAIRTSLRRYVEIRANLTTHSDIGLAIAESEKLQDQMRAVLVQLAGDSGMHSADVVLFRALGQVFDYHNRRVAAALHYRIPGSIWPALFTILMLSMIGLGFTFGLKGSHNHAASLALALSFSMVVYLTADLDRATSGLLHADQSEYQSLAASMRSR